ncbi:MAG TPA: hypothetical protein PLW93_00300 [Candidatus Absconditabacterales bacterium]|nr:hypothetical protein [Candidatus Absconditabacterales bacterium]
MLWNDFSKGLSETREAIADGYFYDSEAIETRLNPGVRLAKYNELFTWNVSGSETATKIMGVVPLGNDSIKDIWAFARNGNIFRYYSYDPVYTGITDYFPAGDITDIVESPRGVYAFWQQNGSTGTAVSCKIYYVPKNTISAGSTDVESLTYGLIHASTERITFTHNNASSGHFYGKKFGTLVDNQALMWAAKDTTGKTSIYMMDYESLIPLVSQPGTIVDTLPGTCTGISSQGSYVYVYMQDKVFYYANGDLLNGKSTSLIPTGVLNVAFKIYDVLPGDTSDWVMTSNGVYQRSGLNFTLMSGVTFGTFNGMISNSPLINAVGRGNETLGTKLTTYGRKNNFFPGGFVGSEYVDGYESTVFAKEDVYVYSNGTTIKLIKKGTNTGGGNVDAPGFAPVSENKESGIFAPSGKISSCRFYAPSFRTFKNLKKLDISFQLNGGTIALDARTDVNTTFTEIGSWTSSIEGGATIYASQFSSILSNKFNWIEYRVRITRGADTTTTPIFYGIIPVYEEQLEEF